ncbi:hypothetical protein ABEB36_004068 [Hypothenemus hampei]|uniref:Major facilitator superfamily (MFS) profile domain-containing protein n=1 Tax=Hypothenemus hampei TaxID=57062 RepID=A0ABD1F4R1_HYPHA
MAKTSNVTKEYNYFEVNQDEKKKNEEETQPLQAPKLGVRHIQILAYFLLVLIAFGFRVSLSVAIVAMTDSNINNSTNIPIYPEWKEKNLILSAFFWGYIIPQVIAGWAAGKFGAKWLLIAPFTVQCLLAFLMPFTAARFGSMGLIVSRSLQGFCQGHIFPSLTHLLSRWVPQQERAFLGSIVFAASSLGTVLAIAITGVIAASSYGWPLVFYGNGILGFLWVVIFIFVGYDSPANHPWISEAEKQYADAPYKTPWKSIMTSLPVWALLVSQTGNNYCFWTLLTQIPTYMNYVMHFNIKSNSLLSALPYLTLWIFSFFVGYISDLIVNKRLISITTSRKIFNTIGLCVPALALVILAFISPDQKTQAVILLIFAVSFNAAVFAGWGVNHMDLAPNNAGTLMGICNGFSQITGAAAPLVVQSIVIDESDILQWRKVFLITAGFNVITSLIFDIFGSGKPQPWSGHERKEEAKA